MPGPGPREHHINSVQRSHYDHRHGGTQSPNAEVSLGGIRRARSDSEAIVPQAKSQESRKGGVQMLGEGRGRAWGQEGRICSREGLHAGMASSSVPSSWHLLAPPVGQPRSGHWGITEE